MFSRFNGRGIVVNPIPIERPVDAPGMGGYRKQARAWIRTQGAEDRKAAAEEKRARRAQKRAREAS